MSYSAADSYRKMHRTTVLTSFVTLIPLGVLVVAMESSSWLETIVLLIGLGGAFLVISQWGVDGIPRFGVPALAVTTLVWGICAWQFDNHMGFFPLVMAGSVVIPRVPRWKAGAALGFAVLVAGLGALRLLVAPATWEEAFQYILLPGGLALFVTGVMFLSDKYWVIFRELEQARKAEAELGIVQERMRFASELHDIQGHTLHVVKLKLALAQKLLRTDLERAEEELKEVHELVGDTITQTKELAYAQHKLNLSAELENAKNLFEAADIAVSIQREGTISRRDHELLGQVLRETTTNILRHADAQKVRIRVSSAGIAIINDGAGSGPTPQLSGLAMLRRRIAEQGGELTAERRKGEFLTEVVLPPEPSSIEPSSTGSSSAPRSVSGGSR